ncbi:L-gulonate 5-dehydrogenase [Aequitasia blattaphilus]|uniref:Alcohol dehydrogenase catalytic domain-containing protein n=1 Tax=Aequitasia blattaphilus TaxID=2949332 RepID=A0ABT1EAF6_9FIRM|nr:alcohol dehydrogenase catalytic domain-containing protein [Aequitasia blattaphilus]MCP1102792.1 alcohol dehydrogenase catalytic domain-containing protein [Aequitasia blattaphilus]MCR8615432.1 alcohol dehydrogenase catalytic domain-containing protein [Aequitasia blattaphilus]
MSNMMKEVVVIKPHEFAVREVEIPEPKGNEVLIQMKSAGVCGSDHHIYHGANPCSTYPRIPGHENAGIVAKVGEDVENVKVGDHVIVDLIHTCGECYQCGIGRKNVCEKVKVRGSGMDGGFREYFTAPEDEVYKISESVSWKDAALVEPYAIGAHCTTRGRVVPEDVVLILGTGTIGAIILQTCKAKGCKTVICCDINEGTLKRARDFGADYVINTKEENLVDAVQRITKGHGVTIAFDAACYPGSLAAVMQPGIVCNAGRIVPLGFCTAPEEITQAMINQRELDIIGTRMSCYQFEPTIKQMEKKAFDTEGIGATYIRFSEIEKVFYYMDNPDSNIKKMVILFDE